MKAMQLVEPRRFRVVEIAEPGPPGEGEALVQVHRVGICGTDISSYLGKMPFFGYPRIPGHELGVEVLAVGAGVTRVRVGDRCSVEPYLNCEECLACRRGRPNCCLHLQVLGVHTDGGLRPRFVLPARKLHPSPHLALEQLALVETLGIGCHAVDRGAPEPGEQVLVVGAGPIGLSVIEFLRLADAHITVIDTNPRRLEFCRETMGVEHVLQPAGDGAEIGQLEALHGGALPTLVFDATGNTDAMGRAFHYVAHTGRLVLVGIVPGDICFPDPLLHARELTLCATRNALPRDFTRILALIEEGRIDTRPWITHRTPFDALPEQFPDFTRPETGVIKAMVEMTENARPAPSASDDVTAPRSVV